jgi:predicted thioredoxin/glutaredoxin
MRCPACDSNNIYKDRSKKPHKECCSCGLVFDLGISNGKLKKVKFKNAHLYPADAWTISGEQSDCLIGGLIGDTSSLFYERINTAAVQNKVNELLDALEVDAVIHRGEP